MYKCRCILYINLLYLGSFDNVIRSPRGCLKGEEHSKYTRYTSHHSTPYSLLPLLYRILYTMPRQPAARQHHNNHNNHHHQQQQQQQQHQQPGTSFGASSDSSTSYLSSRSRVQSPRSNFNPFSPLSPDLAEKELGEVDDDSGAMFRMEDAGNAVSRASRVYSRAQLLVVARDGREKGWVKPAGMAPLESWFG